MRESRLPVGSSAKMISGWLASARATATRCCWPPESSLGRCWSRSLQTDGVDHLVEPLLVGLATGQRHRQGDVLQRCQCRDQVERLEDEADLVPPQHRELAIVELRQVGVTDEDAAPRQRVEAGDDVHQRALAGAAGAHDGGELTGLEVDGHGVECGHCGVAAAVALGGPHGTGGEGGAARVVRRGGECAGHGGCPFRSVEVSRTTARCASPLMHC